MARNAAQSNDWRTVSACAKKILRQNRKNPEGYFLRGLAETANRRTASAARDFLKAIHLDPGRYDAAIELAGQYLQSNQYGEAAALLRRYERHMVNSPRYLDMAGSVYTNIGLPERGWPLYRRADELQPGVDSIRANLAACSVYVGKISDAKELYRQLLRKYPNHQRYHYELSRLEKAVDRTHIDQMRGILRTENKPEDKNIFMYYAIGKELEDLEQWDEAFHYFEIAGNAASRVANYDVSSDVQLIDKVIEVCDAAWIARDTNDEPKGVENKTPIFIVGLPRTGTTLTERILSCHSQIESIGESFFMQIALARVARTSQSTSMNPAVIEAAAKRRVGRIAQDYLASVAYRFGDKPMFIEKLPENFLYLGFIAREFPLARMIYVKRHPMDACFAMYKQSFFRFAYNLQDLGQYYVAHDRLLHHWREVLGDRLTEVEYESMVADQGGQTRQLVKKLGLQFEDSCLDFELNAAASNTASTVQIREKIHTRSVNRWKHYENKLAPLKQHLENAGIELG